MKSPPNYESRLLVQPHFGEVLLGHAEKVPGFVQEGDTDLFAQFLSAMRGTLPVSYTHLTLPTILLV